jgi:hypothetical protein
MSEIGGNGPDRSHRAMRHRAAPVSPATALTFDGVSFLVQSTRLSGALQAPLFSREQSYFSIPFKGVSSWRDSDN